MQAGRPVGRYAGTQVRRCVGAYVRMYVCNVMQCNAM